MSQALNAKSVSKSKTPRFFGLDRPVRYEGPQSKDPLAFRWYDPNKKVLGKKLADHLRLAVCYWHTFCWGGGDPFGGSTLIRPWFDTGDPMGEAKMKADVAFEMYEALGVPFFTFHDRDIAPEGSTLAESNKNVRDHRRYLRAQDGKGEGAPAVGHRQSVLATGATWPAPPPIPIPTCSPMPPRR